MNTLTTSIISLTTICIIPQALHAQKNSIINENISSLQVVAEERWLQMPIISLKGNDVVNISFDDITHVYHRYVYKIEHCEADWQTSTEIFDSDYCEGFSDGNTIDDIEQSLNTNTLYTHYRLSIPNEKCKIKLSGNYRVTIYDENTSDTILTACFMVVEPLMKIGLSVTSNTDIDTNNSHQQVGMSLDYSSISITDPERELHTVVMQNAMWDTQRRDVKPQYTTPQGMKWEHNKSLIFNGGNEYRKFEILSTDHPTLGIEDISWDGNDYNAQIWTDMPRPSYVYDEDANGAFYIRNSDNYENDRISDYINVMFRLKAPRQNGRVYVSGIWTNQAFTPKYEMQYNPLTEQYETIIKLKQGYYSYQYLMVSNDGNILPVSSEGNFYQTENEYQALVYWHGIGQRTDRLVGYNTIRFK